MSSILREILNNKFGVAGLSIIIGLGLLSLVILSSAKVDVVAAWNDHRLWVDNPRVAMPEWVNAFGLNLPKNTWVNLTLRHRAEGAGFTIFEYAESFYWDYQHTPSAVIIYVDSRSSNAFLELRIRRPDGIEIAYETSISRMTYRWNLDAHRELSERVRRALGPGTPSTLLFTSNGTTLKGVYRIYARVISFDKNDVGVAVLLVGRVYGLAGTDDIGRDLALGLSFGIPLAYLLGVIAAVAISFIQAFLGVAAGWYGKRVDNIIERLAEIYMLLPLLPILITISVFIGKLTIYTLLVVIIILSIVGVLSKTVRAYTLQIKTEAYIEAAKLAGAGDLWIITRHIFPRVLLLVIANAVLAVPSIIYLEAALSLLGFGDPTLPTLGQIIERCFAQGAIYHGYWWWILIPSSVLVLITLGFAFLGYALDQIVNPMLKQR